MRESRYLREIRRLDPVADHSRIVYLDTCFEFPWDTTRSLELALFRTFAVPSIAAVLDTSGEFGRAPQKRYDDTDLILSTIVEAGYESEEGKEAIRRMNRIHGRFGISNEDFLYVLSSFVFEPIRWNARFGWRPLIETEKLATFEFWREVGRRMAIKEIPERYAELEAYNEEYERRALPADGAVRAGRPRHARHVPRLVPVAPEAARRAGDLRADGRPAPGRVRVPATAARVARSRRNVTARSRTARRPPSPAPPSAPPHETEDADVRTRVAARGARARELAPPRQAARASSTSSAPSSSASCAIASLST